MTEKFALIKITVVVANERDMVRDATVCYMQNKIKYLVAGNKTIQGELLDTQKGRQHVKSGLRNCRPDFKTYLIFVIS